MIGFANVCETCGVFLFIFSSALSFRVEGNVGHSGIYLEVIVS